MYGYSEVDAFFLPFLNSRLSVREVQVPQAFLISGNFQGRSIRDLCTQSRGCGRW